MIRETTERIDTVEDFLALVEEKRNWRKSHSSGGSYLDPEGHSFSPYEFS